MHASNNTLLFITRPYIIESPLLWDFYLFFIIIVIHRHRNRRRRVYHNFVYIN